MKLILDTRIRLIGFCLLLAACEANITNVDLDGTLTILEPSYSHSSETMREEWIIVGNIEQFESQVLIENQKLYLAITSGKAPFTALRPIKAQLLATPFLSWEWRIMENAENHAPIRLTIGFADSEVQNERWLTKKLWKPAIPEFSRSLTIEWGRSALQRGVLQIYKKSQTELPTARYISRGGRENLGRWWREIVDLSSLHSKAWPELDMQNTEIVFAGFIVNKLGSRMSGHLGSIRLSR